MSHSEGVKMITPEKNLMILTFSWLFGIVIKYGNESLLSDYRLLHATSERRALVWWDLFLQENRMRTPYVLSHIPLLKCLSPEDRAELEKNLRVQRVKKGEVLFRKESEGGTLYLIQEGTIKIVLFFGFSISIFFWNFSIVFSNRFTSSSGVRTVSFSSMRRSWYSLTTRAAIG